jgi:hypothetical protein
VRLSGRFDLGIETTSVGRDGANGALRVAEERAEGQELVLLREDHVEERFLAGPLGLEHSFVVRERPGGRGPLVIEVAFDGLVAESVNGAADRVLLRDSEGVVEAGYRDLVALEADGRELKSRMEVRGAVVALVVEDADANYPVTIDPLVWTQQAELTGNAGQESVFGMSVAVDADTIVVGASNQQVGANAAQGAAHVFVRSAAGWIQQAQLTASDGMAGDHFGGAVALSGDTAIVTGRGAEYVFVRSGTTWAQQAELSVSGFVALSGDTLVVGTRIETIPPTLNSPGWWEGVVYVFVRSGTTWTQQAELTESSQLPGACYNPLGGGPAFGGSVAVSGDTVVVGSCARAFVFVRSGTTWSQQAELGDVATNSLSFGAAVGLSGETIIVGDCAGGLGNLGAAYVFTQSGTTWTQQADFSSSDAAIDDEFGCTLALDGDTVLVGAYGHQVGANMSQGAGYVFTRSGTTWTQQAEVLASDGAAYDEFGQSVALSGSTAVVASPSHQASDGAVYIFVPPPPAANGTACTVRSDCESTFCVDGLCCDTACGGGVASDCQSCLAAMTGGPDGTCGTVTATAKYTCRPAAGPCDPAGMCDGSSTSCPPDTATPAAGCASASSSSSSSSSSGAASANMSGRCGCRTVGDHGETNSAVWLLALGLGLGLGRRCRCRAILATSWRP